MIVVKEAYFRCIIPEENRSAFYELRLIRCRDGYVLHRKWGRIGTSGQRSEPEEYRDLESATGGFERVKRIRLRHNYRLVQEWPREKREQPARVEPFQQRLPMAV